MKPPAITIFVQLAAEETQEQAIICLNQATQHLKVKLSSDHKMQDSVSLHVVAHQSTHKT